MAQPTPPVAALPVAPLGVPEPVPLRPLTATTRASGTHVLTPGDGQVSVVVEVQGAAQALAGVRLPLNISLVIDRSGSMRGDKMAETREAARRLVDHLEATDTLSVVSYSDDVRVDLPAGRLNDEHRTAALAAIAAIQPGGSTNLSAGLMRGHDEIARNLGPAQVNRVVLMSDGIANRGITDTGAVAAVAKREAQRGISVTTIGVGTDYNEDLMTALADNGSGNYYFVASAGAIPTVLSSELAKLKSTVALDARVELEIADGAELVQVYGYSFTREGDRVTIPLAELFAGQRRSIAIQLSVPALREGLASVGAASVVYTDPSRLRSTVRVRMPIDVVVTKDAALVEKGRDRSVEERLLEIKAANVLLEAANLVRDGQRDKANVLLITNQHELEKRAEALGGSGRVSVQAENLRRAQVMFEAAAAPSAAPAAASEAVKKAKADSFDLGR